MAQKQDYFKDTIKAYLDKRAENDALFAQSYSKTNKSLDECVNFIYQEVRASGRNGFCDDEIYSMAVHYYDEDNLGKITGANCKVVVNHSIELTDEEKEKARERAVAQYEAAELLKLQSANSAKPQKKEVAKPKPQTTETTRKVHNTPSLFDFDMEEEDEA